MDADCWFSIFDCLNLKELVNCFLISKQFNRIVRYNHFWLRFLKSDFQIDDIHQDTYYKYKEYFVLNEFLLYCKLDLTKIRKSDHITLDSANIHDIPSEFGLLTNLKVIYLDDNFLAFKNLPMEFTKLTNLKELHLSDNFFDSIPSAIFSLTGLQKLDMEYNQIKVIPSEIGLLTNLTSLNMHANKIKTVSPKIGNLTNLRSLLLSYNELQSLPSEIGQLDNLAEINLNCNSLQSLPSEIGLLSNLKIMISDDRRGLLPDNMRRLCFDRLNGCAVFSKY